MPVYRLRIPMADSPTYRLTDEQWDALRDLLPTNTGKRGGQWHDHRTMIDGILWALADGGRWRNVPAEFGPRQSVYDRFASAAGPAPASGTTCWRPCAAARRRPAGSTAGCTRSTGASSAPTSRRPGRQKNG